MSWIQPRSKMDSAVRRTTVWGSKKDSVSRSIKVLLTTVTEGMVINDVSHKVSPPPSIIMAESGVINSVGKIGPYHYLRYY